jgi:hypothetical protein
MYRVLQNSLKSGELSWLLERHFGVRLGVADKSDLIRRVGAVDHTDWEALECHVQNYLQDLGYHSAELSSSAKEDQRSEKFCIATWKNEQ